MELNFSGSGLFFNYFIHLFLFLYRTQVILSLYQQNYVLLLSEKGTIDREALPIPQTYPLKIYRHKVDFDDINHDYIDNYNAKQFQAILVRPDGHIAWRS
ncbi:hypothetical protein [Candidiatus Paracoxiella cheracis]|uniref:hypothetical protein n=1 Tax=Candidiatus Paracoxiella cheracis TaxID=3405120 RepID=UPI003BF5E7E9